MAEKLTRRVWRGSHDKGEDHSGTGAALEGHQPTEEHQRCAGQEGQAPHIDPAWITGAKPSPPSHVWVRRGLVEKGGAFFLQVDLRE